MKTAFIYGLLICSTILICKTTLRAQDVYAGFAFGPAFNYINPVNSSGIFGSYNDQMAPVLSYSLNAHLSVQSSTFGFTIEPGYIKKAGRLGDFNNGLSSQFSFHYIQLPLLFDIHFTHRFYVSLGGDFSYLLPIGSAPPGFNNSSVEFYDIAAIGSVSYSITSNLDLCLRYNYGFRSQPPIYIPGGFYNTYYTISGGKNMHGQLLLRVKFGGASANNTIVEQ